MVLTRKLALLMGLLFITSAQAKFGIDRKLPKLIVYNGVPEHSVWVTEGLFHLRHHIMPKELFSMKVKTGHIRFLKVEVEDDTGVMHQAKHCPTHEKRSLRFQVLPRKHHAGQYVCEAY